MNQLSKEVSGYILCREQSRLGEFFKVATLLRLRLMHTRNTYVSNMIPRHLRFESDNKSLEFAVNKIIKDNFQLAATQFLDSWFVAPVKSATNHLIKVIMILQKLNLENATIDCKQWLGMTGTEYAVAVGQMVLHIPSVYHKHAILTWLLSIQDEVINQFETPLSTYLSQNYRCFTSTFLMMGPLLKPSFIVSTVENADQPVNLYVLVYYRFCLSDLVLDLDITSKMLHTLCKHRPSFIPDKFRHTIYTIADINHANIEGVANKMKYLEENSSRLLNDSLTQYLVSQWNMPRCEMTSNIRTGIPDDKSFNLQCIEDVVSSIDASIEFNCLETINLGVQYSSCFICNRRKVTNTQALVIIKNGEIESNELGYKKMGYEWPVIMLGPVNTMSIICHTICIPECREIYRGYTHDNVYIINKLDTMAENNNVPDISSFIYMVKLGEN
jgi:hypothetical protein